MKFLSRLLLIALIVGGIGYGVYWYKQQQAAKAPPPGPPPPAKVASIQVTAEAWEPRLLAVGTLVANKGISVTSEVSGLVRRIAFESGDKVKQGDVLLQLDDSVDRAELAGLQAERDLAKIKYDRLARLIKDRSVSQSDVDEARAQLKSMQAQVKGKQAVIARKTIRAPFSGHLGIRQVDQGEFLSPGAPIVPLQQLAPIYVDFAVPERHLNDLEVGQRVTLTVASRAGRTFEGRISALNPGVDVASRTVKLRASLPNADGALRPGMFAEVSVWLPERASVTTLPRVAVSYNTYGDTVFVLKKSDKGMTVSRQQIRTGQIDGDRVEVVSGLKVGDEVVLAGQVKLRNGQGVVIDNAVRPGAKADAK